METLENVVDEDGGDEVGNTPRPASWSPLVSFPPTALILVTSSSNSLPHPAVAVFW
jgi:hypothetical protein